MRQSHNQLPFLSLVIMVMLGAEAEIRSVALAQDRTISVTGTENRQRERELRSQVEPHGLTAVVPLI